MDYDWRHITSGIPSTGNHSGKTLFAAVSFDSYLMTSEDSINWTLQPDPTGNGLNFGVFVQELQIQVFMQIKHYLFLLEMPTHLE